MNYLTFRKKLIGYKIFSLHEVEKLFLNFNRVNLVNWQKKGYLIKLRNGWYRFKEIPSNEWFLFIIANRIYSPSYISFETAANWHGLIPEAVFTVTSATTLKTAMFSNKDGRFKYNTLKNSLYFGYELVEMNGSVVRIANIEKTLLDWFYIKSDINETSDIEGLRLNKKVLKEKINYSLLENYLEIYASPIIMKRITLLKQYLND
jgi:predicted transcriptional regulator of viral defense system